VGDEEVDMPCVPPRLEMRRLIERIVANVAAVLLWTASRMMHPLTMALSQAYTRLRLAARMHHASQGIWNLIDSQLLPVMCSADACAQCDSYGEFPCAWYKIAFVLVGLVGLFFTRSLYNDGEVTYAPRRASVREHCAACGWSGCTGDGGRT
jgi:hypothetical protein